MRYRCWSDSEQEDLRELDCVSFDEAAEHFFALLYDEVDDLELRNVIFYVQEGTNKAGIVEYRGTARVRVEFDVISTRVLPQKGNHGPGR